MPRNPGFNMAGMRPHPRRSRSGIRCQSRAYRKACRHYRLPRLANVAPHAGKLGFSVVRSPGVLVEALNFL